MEQNETISHPNIYNNVTKFRVKDLDEVIGLANKEPVKIRLSEIDYSDRITQSLTYERYDHRQKLKELREQEEKQNKVKPSLVNDTPSNSENKPIQAVATKSPSKTLSEEGNSLEGVSKKGRGGKIDSKEMDELKDKNLPYHLTLSAEELRRKKLEALERTIPNGSISNGITGIHKEVAELMETLLRRMIDKNKLVDHYFYIDNNQRKMAFDKYDAKMLAKSNKELKKESKLDKKESKQREKQVKEIARAMKKMDFKVPEEEGLKDISLLLNIIDSNPELDVKKMSKDEKKLYKEVIEPMVKEANEKNLSFSDIMNDKDSQQKLDSLYEKHKVTSMEKTIKEEMRVKASGLSPTM